MKKKYLLALSLFISIASCKKDELINHSEEKIFSQKTQRVSNFPNTQTNSFENVGIEVFQNSLSGGQVAVKFEYTGSSTGLFVTISGSALGPNSTTMALAVSPGVNQALFFVSVLQTGSITAKVTEGGIATTLTTVDVYTVFNSDIIKTSSMPENIILQALSVTDANPNSPWQNPWAGKQATFNFEWSAEYKNSDRKITLLIKIGGPVINGVIQSGSLVSTEVYPKHGGANISVHLPYPSDGIFYYQILACGEEVIGPGASSYFNYYRPENPPYYSAVFAYPQTIKVYKYDNGIFW